MVRYRGFQHQAASWDQPRGVIAKHARYFVLQLAESDLTQRLFRQMLGRIERLAGHRDS